MELRIFANGEPSGEFLSASKRDMEWAHITERDLKTSIYGSELHTGGREAVWMNLADEAVRKMCALRPSYLWKL